MLLLMTLSISVTLITSFMKHPLSLGMVLLIQSLITSLITSQLFITTWFSYILFLIMIGGMMVLFIYMTSVASNEKFSVSTKPMITIMLSIMLLILMKLYFPGLFFHKYKTSMMNETMYKMTTEPQLNAHISTYMNTPINMNLIIVMIYLFVTLIAVVKMTNIKSGPIRQKN